MLPYPPARRTCAKRVSGHVDPPRYHLLFWSSSWVLPEEERRYSYGIRSHPMRSHPRCSSWHYHHYHHPQPQQLRTLPADSHRHPNPTSKSSHCRRCRFFLLPRCCSSCCRFYLFFQNNFVCLFGCFGFSYFMGRK